MKKRFNKIIGKNIKYYREKMNLDQDQLGYLFLRIAAIKENKNKAQQRITKFETGRKEPTASELYELSKILKVDIRKFFH